MRMKQRQGALPRLVAQRRPLSRCPALTLLTFHWLPLFLLQDPAVRYLLRRLMPEIVSGELPPRAAAELLTAFHNEYL